MRFVKRTILMAGLIATILATGARAPAQTKLLRFPDVHGNRVVFTYAGDLWTAAVKGGTARRLTAHPGLELFAKFSPDGKQIAFTGQYDGDEQVYVVDSEGGAPRQLTYYPARGPLPPRWGYDNQVYGWTREGDAVLFRSMRHGWTLTDTRLYTASLEGGLPKALPMTVSGGGDYSPDNRQVVYSPLTRDFRTWKRYQGGWAQDLYLFDLESHEIEQVTDHPRTDRDPMWIGRRIYFASDRDGTLNLYYYDLDAEKTEQVTQSKTHDVRWPSKGNKAQIVYELNGELYLLNTKTGKSRKIKIDVPNDGLAMRPKRISAADRIEGYGLSPKGERALFVARGDVFTAPIEKGPTRNLTKTSGAHDKHAAWSPDGSRIVFISDRDGEEELYLVDQKGGEPAKLTDGGRAMRYSPRWSPDGKRIVFSDKDGKVYVLTVEDKKLREIADERHGQVSDYTWSPHGGHLAFSLEDDNGLKSIYIWSVADKKLRRITGPYFNEFEPVWDPEGKYLYYFADRQFAPQIGSFEWNYVIDRETDIFAIALRKDVPHPFPPESDEVTVEKKEEEEEGEDDRKKEVDSKEEKEDDKGKDEKKESEPDEEKHIKIDFDGLAERATRAPVESDNYSNLNAVKGHLLFVRGAPFYYGRSADVKPAIRIFSIKDRKTTTLVEGAGGYALSDDLSKVLVRQGGGYQMLDAKPGGGSKKSVSTSGLVVDLTPREEWEQIFDEVWRRYRDFFYVENLHGYDWKKLRAQYRPLLKHVAHRSDLNYVIGEMIAELNVGHAYMAGGDFEIPDRPDAALPGAVLELDADAGRYRLAHIYQGDNEEAAYRSPLTEIGIDAKDGDYVLAIDGEELTAGDNPYQRLLHKDDRPVTLTLNDTPDEDGARQVSYRPITSESNLVYLDWVAKNRAKVDKLTDGRVGYLHLPDMGDKGIREFNKWFYGQIRKEGLVVDVRNNGGGNVSQMIINRLRRTLLATGFSRTNDSARTYPYTVFHGHLVCILNENSASDGDIFPAMFREAKLGPLVGKRSWGGVIGITNRGTLIDGGTVFVPEFGFASADGEWVIEGYGVDPDIEVDNDPRALIEGRDPQLQRAVEEVLKNIEENPKRLPERPAPPIKTKQAASSDR